MRSITQRSSVRLGIGAVITLTITLTASACVEDASEPILEEEWAELPGADEAQLDRGRDIWFENTYGGQKFFTFLANHPDPAKRIDIGFAEMVETPRAQRFDVWGVLNDPDCVANPAGGADLCDDPEATGVVGIRKFPGPGGTTMYGTACAGCHAGFDPLNPPDDPNEPVWANIHPTIGNQYAKFGQIFAANLAPTDPRALMFMAWPDGAVDTTALFPDSIMNPGVVTAFWEHPNRPTFDVGMDTEKLRNGQGGEDDIGGDLAALRVYTNIGVCFAECVVAPLQTGTPIDIDTCYETCPDFPPQADLDDMSAFLASITAPRLPKVGVIPPVYAYGRWLFERKCADCHDNTGPRKKVLSDDEVNALTADPANATNACRALSSNWEEGKIWAQFSSQVYKDRVTDGDRGYRTMPLAGIWSTAPFTHNQSIGTWAPADASVLERVESYWDSMFELMSDARDPLIHTTPVAVGPFPAGTPLHYIFSRSPTTGQVLCNDLVENKGHHYGASMSVWDKAALTYWLQYQ